jgi:predicted dehydrogenase
MNTIGGRNMTHGVGIIGVGMIAELHAKAIETIEGAKVVACFDINKERVDYFSSTYGCTGYTDLDKFLENEEVTVVNICTPSGLHLDSALKAAKAKKHLIIEKPLEISTARCDAIINAAKENDVVLSGLFPSRFHDVSQLIKDVVEEGRLGKIVLGDAYVKWFRSQEYYDSSRWKGTWALDGGGALMNQSIHAIDLLSWFMGPVESVMARSKTLTHSNIEVEDTAVAILNFANGAMGVIEGTTSSYPGFFKKIEISGNSGSVVMEEENIVMWKFLEEHDGDETIRKEFSGKTKTGGGAADPKAIGYIGHKKQFINVFDAIENKGELLIDGNEARKAVEIIEAIYLSSKENRVVTLPLR